jgi:hypothetical protein
MATAGKSVRAAMRATPFTPKLFGASVLVAVA